MVAHASNSRSLGGQGRQITRSRNQDHPGSTKNTKSSWAWRHVPVVPATRDAEAEELHEPGRWRLQ